MNYFFELIQIAVGTRKELSGVPSPHAWALIFHEAQRQALLGVLYGAVEKLPAAQRPEKKVLLSWYAVAEQIKEHNRMLNYEAVRIGKLLEEKEIDYVLLKGQGNATFYPDPLLRNPGDLDIWVRSKDWVHASLRTRRKKLIAWIKPMGKLEGVSYVHVHAPLSEVAEVELHVTPSWLSAPYLNKPLQAYFEHEAATQFKHRVDLPEEAGSMPIPTLSFNRFYLLLHIYHHLFTEGVGLRQLMDYYFILCQPVSDAVKEDTLQKLRQYKMLGFAGAVMYVMQRVFGMPDEWVVTKPDPIQGQFLLKEILQAGNFGQYDKRINRKAYQSLWKRFLLSLTRSARFAKQYPHEVYHAPFFRIKQFIYTKSHGWR